MKTAKTHDENTSYEKILAAMDKWNVGYDEAQQRLMLVLSQVELANRRLEGKKQTKSKSYLDEDSYSKNQDQDFDEIL